MKHGSTLVILTNITREKTEITIKNPDFCFQKVPHIGNKSSDSYLQGQYDVRQEVVNRILAYARKMID